MEQPINQFDSTPKNNSVLLPVIITFALIAIIVGGGIYWWANQKQNELKNEIAILNNQISQLRQVPVPNPAQTTQPTFQQPPETTPVEDSNDGTKINQTTVYKNTTLRFQMTFPAGWYLPTATDEDPHAYSCATYYCQNGALEIQQHGYFADKNFDEFLSEWKKEDPNAKELTNFIAGARVVKASAPGPAEGWSYEYDIIFYGQKTGFLILTDSDKLETSILSSFKLLQ
ncbi:MAG: hypothetical protein Q7K16_01130 [Candidatus Azambacteria bacterium]|nr:hypothetical protein [Candidatus Azambacteria bacterium]